MIDTTPADDELVAVVAHTLLTSVTIVGAYIDDDGLDQPDGFNRTLTAHRHLDRIAQILVLLAQGRVELAASAITP